MVEYSMSTLWLYISQKINLKRHLNRKNICKPILEDISIEEVKKHYGFIHSTKIHQNPPKLHQNPPNHPPKISTKNPPKIHQNRQIYPPKSTKIHQN